MTSIERINKRYDQKLSSFDSLVNFVETNGDCYAINPKADTKILDGIYKVLNTSDIRRIKVRLNDKCTKISQNQNNPNTEMMPSIFAKYLSSKNGSTLTELIRCGVFVPIPKRDVDVAFLSCKAKADKTRRKSVNKLAKKEKKEKIKCRNTEKNPNKKTGVWYLDNRAVLLKKATVYEKRILEALPLELKKIAVQQRIFHEGGKLFYFDIFLEGYNVAIEADGESHEGREVYDKERDEFVAKYGIRTFRISNNDVKKRRTLDAFIDTIGDWCLGRKESVVLYEVKKKLLIASDLESLDTIKLAINDIVKTIKQV